MSAVLVELRGAAVRYGRGPAVLTDLDLSLRPGERVAVVGPSGCGKSTLLAVLAGQVPATTGALRLPGRPALAAQDPVLLPWLTAAGNVALPLRLRGVRRRVARAEAEGLLDLVDLGGAAGRRPHQLSGGMRQRVALARALAQDGDLLLLDEPFAALDQDTRARLVERLRRRFETTGGAVVLVTHDRFEADRLAHRVVTLPGRPVPPADRPAGIPPADVPAAGVPTAEVPTADVPAAVR